MHHFFEVRWWDGGECYLSHVTIKSTTTSGKRYKSHLVPFIFDLLASCGYQVSITIYTPFWRIEIRYRLGLDMYKSNVKF